MLESVRAQSFQDYEVVIVNANEACRDILSEFDVKEVYKRTGKLEARYLAHQRASGEFGLFLEETRILFPFTLQKLSNYTECDMAMINEIEIGNRFINRLNRMDMEIASKMDNPDPNALNVLPRYFGREVLDYAFEKSSKSVPKYLFPKIVASDQEIIYFEAYQKYNKIAKPKEVLLKKYGESSIKESMLKYYNYGKTQKLLKNTKYEKSLGVKGRFRKIPSLRYIPAVMAIYAIRGLPFLAGYYL